ncbi:uncharacterized protein LOC129598775 [Paramacrobiotus metropolitanus]|uniref:uncharacterized protein LOC129598775 n=1 Tax=Paramacrobiotus metropolitanus TaxID=2943436 RepID=UPI002445D802|nr:uncharacterized protein LOC129598775 [Paramacrobiotus metropolitanus]
MYHCHFFVAAAALSTTSSLLGVICSMYHHRNVKMLSSASNFVGLFLFLCFVVVPEITGEVCRETPNDFSCLCASTTPIDFPRSYDVNKIPSTTMRLVLGSRQELPDQRPINRSLLVYCNLLRKDHTSIPDRGHLRHVHLHNFIGEGGRRPPFKQFLRFVQYRIETLRIGHSKIGHLDADFLHGFPELKQLDLSENDIYDISIDAFQEFQGYPASRAEMFDNVLNLAGNALEELNWRAFEPLSYWVKSLELGQQNPKLRTIHMSGAPFEFGFLSDLDMKNNDLTFIPDDVLRSLKTVESFDLQGSMLCAVDDCSCCETQPFLQMILSKTTVRTGGWGTPSSRRGAFSCGSQNFYDYGQQRSEQQMPACPSCKQAPPLDIRCQQGSISLSDTSVEQTDALVVHFTADTTMGCYRIFHDFYHNVLELGNVSQPQPTPSSVIRLLCHDNQISVFGPDPEVQNPLKITLDTDLSPDCHSIRVRFLKFVRNDFLSDGAVTPLLIPNITVKTWMADHFACPVDAPLRISCQAGKAILPVKMLNSTKSTVVYLRGDASLRCREFVISVHEYLIDSQRSSVHFDASQDAIVAVCQRGHIVLSESNPRISVKTNLTYYGAPNDPCQKKLRDFLNYIQEIRPH